MKPPGAAVLVGTAEGQHFDVYLLTYSKGAPRPLLLLSSRRASGWVGMPYNVQTNKQTQRHDHAYYMHVLRDFRALQGLFSSDKIRMPTLPAREICIGIGGGGCPRATQGQHR